MVYEKECLGVSSNDARVVPVQPHHHAVQDTTQDVVKSSPTLENIMPSLDNFQNYNTVDADIYITQVLPSQPAVPDQVDLIHLDADTAGDLLSTTTPQRESTRGMNTVSKSNPVKSEGCEYKRGGWCLKHMRQGERVLKTRRTWESLGNGLFGNKLKKKVTWE